MSYTYKSSRPWRILRTVSIGAGALILLAALVLQAAGVVWLASLVDEAPSLQTIAAVAVDEVVEAGIVAPPERPYDPIADGRRVVVTTEINEQTAKAVVERLLLLDSRDPKTPIDLYLSSAGGWGGSAFAMIDAMHGIAARVNVHAIGQCMSACALIMVAATGTRRAGSQTVLMVHANLDDAGYGIDDPHDYDRIYNERYERLWREHARLPADWFPMTFGRTHYLTPQQALELKVIDEIVPARKR